MIKYTIESKLKLQIGDAPEEIFEHVESGEGPIDDLEGTIDMFIKPRFSAIGHVVTGRIKRFLSDFI
jgi:hypothetical protein